jgi:murein L,D-transpeptidase YcbB/YkuD
VAKLASLAAGLASAAILVQSCSPTSTGQHSIASENRLETALTTVTGGAPAWLRSFYAERDFTPLWTQDGSLSPAGKQLIAMFRRSGDDGLDPAAYLKTADAAGNYRASSAHLEIALSLALADYLRDLTRAPPGFFYVDGEVPRRGADIGQLLRAIGHGMPPDRALTKVAPPNPIYLGLKNALIDHRTAVADERTREWIERERTILRNMDRSRALPAMAEGRFLLVDVADARLFMIEDGKTVDEMRVIVGKREEQTPDMAGQLRFTVMNPYWNLPPDLIARRAQRVLVAGPGVIAAERLELLSDWGDVPRRLQADQIDWHAVADGRRKLRVRQLPGRHNMMGRIKFMLPNPLGIYLHDTPLKDLFGRADRRLSSGCVRLEDADRLARWLFRGQAPETGTTPERQVKLPHPVPVYMVYLTAMPDQETISFRADGYGRDTPLYVRRTSVETAGAEPSR